MADMSHLSSSGPPGCLRTSLQAVVSSVVEHKLLVSADGKKKADRTSPPPRDLVLGRRRWRWRWMLRSEGASLESSECNAWQN